MDLHENETLLRTCPQIKVRVRNKKRCIVYILADDCSYILNFSKKKIENDKMFAWGYKTFMTSTKTVMSTTGAKKEVI